VNDNDDISTIVSSYCGINLNREYSFKSRREEKSV